MKTKVIRHQEWDFSLRFALLSPLIRVGVGNTRRISARAMKAKVERR
ncbi:MAG TPA: hypothetical protein VHS80_09935 [Chthoniobacterales bacterium]|nr:hypothetical protein [Chthoniobacterales bacterium]